MKKRAIKVLISISLIIIGILLTGLGFTTKLGHPFSTICYSLGLVIIFLGFIYFIIVVSSND
ncbi:hypothetical protein GCM10022389_29220 [Flavobacterium cheonanense]|jgi:hypothetical protein|uniref:Uncharacterized protein n=1 Tax=Flavobacterium cheonanense TaxID=706183 RepID=A0ABP7W520_9FLAO